MTLISIDNFDKSLDFLSSLDEVAVDTETFFTDSWDNKLIIGVSIYGERSGKSLSCYYPFRHEWENRTNLSIDSLERLAKTFDEIHQIYHNAKFDRQEFVKDGILLKGSFFCTMVASHMVNENENHDLEYLAEKFGIDTQANARKDHLHELRKQMLWHSIPPEVMVPYACHDARNTYFLKPRMQAALAKQEMTQLWPTEEAYSDALMHMECVGIEIDPEMAEEFSLKAARRMGAIKKELGFDPGKPLPLATKLFKELKLPIYEFSPGKPTKQFPKGRPKMNEPIIDRLSREAKSPEAIKVMQLLLEYRGLQKARSTWYDGWLDKIDSKNKLHSTWHQHVAVTTRLTSVKPNMQQIPREDEEIGAAPNPKKLLRAPKGYELWQADYSQIEYRLAGVLSNDPIILEAYRSGSDMHSATGNRLGQTRQAAKTTNFRFIYEGGPTNYAEDIGCTFEEAKRVYSDFHQTYHVMFRFANRVNATAAQRGYIRLWDGRRRHFKFAFETKKAWNSLVQGGAALICKHGLIKCHQDDSLLSRMNSQVHDAIWFEIPEYAIHTEQAKITKHLEWASYDSRFKIKFPVDWQRLA
jgi:DNA polymerase-1